MLNRLFEGTNREERHQQAPKKCPQSHCAVELSSLLGPDLSEMSVVTDIRIYYGGIKERPPWRSWCPRAGTEDETQKDGEREEEKSKSGRRGIESDKRDSKITASRVRRHLTGLASHVNGGSEVEGGTGEKQGGGGRHKRWSKRLIAEMPKIEL